MAGTVTATVVTVTATAVSTVAVGGNFTVAAVVTMPVGGNNCCQATELTTGVVHFVVAAKFGTVVAAIIMEFLELGDNFDLLPHLAEPGNLSLVH